MVKWHVFAEVKPPVSKRVLVVRLSAFTRQWYVDIAKWDGEKWRAGGAVLNVRYWADLPAVPADPVTEDKTERCPQCGGALKKRHREWLVDEERKQDVVWYDCPVCGWSTWETVRDILGD